MLDELNRERLPGIGEDADVLEESDVAAADIAGHQLLQLTVREYRERCMRESLTKQCARHTERLVAMQAAHIERVLDCGYVIQRLLTGNPEKELSEEEKHRRVQRMRKIEFALLMHECAKFNPTYPGGVNPDGHLEETCTDVHAFLADVRRKRKPLVEEITAMVESSGAPYATHRKHTGTRAPGTFEEAVVFAAVNMDAVDFWSAQHIVWIRQHPERLLLPRFAEPARTSLIFAKNMRDEAMHLVGNIRTRSMPKAAQELLLSYGAALWKRSGRFFSFFDEHPATTFTDFRARWNEFFRQEFERGNLWRCISRRNPVSAEQGS